MVHDDTSIRLSEKRNFGNGYDRVNLRDVMELLNMNQRDKDAIATKSLTEKERKTALHFPFSF